MRGESKREKRFWPRDWRLFEKLLHQKCGQKENML